MSDLTDLEADIATSARGPHAAASDGHSVTDHSIAEKIEAARFLAAVEAGKSGAFPLKFFRTIPVDETYYRP